MRPKKKKAFLSFIIPILLALTAVGSMLLFQRRTLELARERTYQSLSNSAAEQTVTLSEIFNGRFAILETFASALAQQSDGVTLDNVTVRMSAIVSASDFENVAVAGLDGVAHTDDGHTDDSSDRFYMTEALAGRRAVEKLRDSRLYGKSRMVLSVPVWENDAVVGVVMGSFSDRDIETLMISTAFAGSAYSFLADPTGEIIVKAETPLLIQGADNLFDKFAALLMLDGATAEGIQADLQSGREGIAAYSNGAEKRYAVYRPTGINDWYIFTVVPGNIVDSATAAQNRFGLICIGSVAICAALLLLIMAWRERRRLRELKQLQEQQLVHYRTDPITGLLNTPGFIHQVTETLPTIPEAQFCAMVDFGIINFNQYNVSFGSPAGNALLNGFSQTLVAHCRTPQPCARLSGDRFACFVYDCPDKEALFEWIATLDKKLHMPEGTHQLLMTYGVYLVDNRALPAEELCDRAVAARLELAGRERIIGLYDYAVHQRQIEDSLLIERMENSLRRGEFVPYYQPKYDARTERIVGAEALVRWIRPDGERIPPDRFIRLFKQNGLITQLDMYMFETVCKKLAAMAEPVPVSVNFSRAHLYDADFPDRLAALADGYGVPRSLLEIELTETIFFDQRDALVQKMARLREQGFLLSIDDFGSGYSSLNVLKDMRFDIIKLDKEFFADTTGTERGRTVVKSVLGLAQALGLRTVAEGVETKGQLEFLRENGCDAIQGYYFSRPVPEAAFDQLMAAQASAAKARAQ